MRKPPKPNQGERPKRITAQEVMDSFPKMQKRASSEDNLKSVQNRRVSMPSATASIISTAESENNSRHLKFSQKIEMERYVYNKFQHKFKEDKHKDEMLRLP